MIESLIPFGQVLLACVIIKYACDQFEQAAGYMGRNMPPSIKGSTVNAIGSSMPEMATCFVVLFLYNDPALFAIALGVTAGSAVFNVVVIPALAILFAKNSNGTKVDHIELDRKNLIRDVFWVVLSDVVLIGLIMYGYISIGWAIVLNLIYVGYAIHLYVDSRKSSLIDDYEEEEMEDYGNPILNILSCNFNKVLFKGAPLTLGNAVVLLAIAIVIITAGSHLLVEGVIGTSNIMGIPNFISGLVLGAAASSIPDLILSIKDATKGNYEDAVANPLASNTFDTSISIGLPLFAWLIWQGESGIDIVAENMEALRISVVAMSFAVGVTLIAKYKRVTKAHAWFMLGMYLGWCGWVYHSYS